MLASPGDPPPAEIRFERVESPHVPLIGEWLNEPHMIEFWDPSPEHRVDLKIFAEGRKKPSAYFGGIFSYWVGFDRDSPYCLIMTAPIEQSEPLPSLWQEALVGCFSPYSIDFAIGAPSYLGKGLAARTLVEFREFFMRSVDSRADAFVIDPDVDNPRARHVYLKAGFEEAGIFLMQGGHWEGRATTLMVWRRPGDGL